MFVSDRMSAPAVTITPGTTFHEALQLMHCNRFRLLPVVDESDQLLGIVAERDLVQPSPSRAGAPSVWELNRLAKVPIREMMTEEVITTTPDVPVEDVAQVMADNKVGGLPVVDEQGRVIGMITETDIFKAFIEIFAGGRSGLRLTLEIPETMDVLLELGQAISELGGNIVSVGSFYVELSGRRGLVVKVRDARKGQLVNTLEALGENVVDARET
jgi:acetoin utilization protein AcuB